MTTLPAVQSGAEVLVASNRGPVAFRLGDDGRLQLARGGGGLVSGVSAVATHAVSGLGLRGAVRRRPDGRDRRAERTARPGRPRHGRRGRAHAADRGPTFRRAYNAVANSTLWYVNHTLFDTPRTPSFDSRGRATGRPTSTTTRAFAEALAEEANDGAKVLVQDYHLLLAPALLRQRRPDLRIGHFTHTPWAEPSYFSLLPDDVDRADPHRHARRRQPRLPFAAMGRGVRALLRAAARRATPVATACIYDGRSTRIAVHALGVDADELRERAAQPDVLARREVLATTRRRARR